MTDWLKAYHVDIGTVLSYGRLLVRAAVVTETDIAQIWPRPTPPDWDFARNRPFPYSYLHHKYREWRTAKTRRICRGPPGGLPMISAAAPSQTAFPDIVEFLFGVDTVNRGVFFRGVARLPGTDGEGSAGVGDRGWLDLRYWSGGGETMPPLARVYELMVSIHSRASTHWLLSVRRVSPDLETFFGCRALAVGHWVGLWIGEAAAAVESVEMYLQDELEATDAFAVGRSNPVLWFYSAMTPEEQRAVVSWYSAELAGQRQQQ